MREGGWRDNENFADNASHYQYLYQVLLNYFYVFESEGRDSGGGLSGEITFKKISYYLSVIILMKRIGYFIFL